MEVAEGEVVKGLEFVRVVFEAMDGKVLRGAQNEDAALGFELVDLVQTLAVVGIADTESLLQFGVAGVEDFTKEIEAIIDIDALRACKDDNDTVAAFLKAFIQGDIVHNAAIEILLASVEDRFAHEWQRSRGTDDIHLGARIGQFDILRPTRAEISDGGEKADTAALERVVVEGIELVRQQVVAEFGVADIAGMEKRMNTDVATVSGIAEVVTEDTAGLVAGEVDTERDTCGGTADDVRAEILLHEHIQDAGCVEAAHATAFEDEADFVGC